MVETAAHMAEHVFPAVGGSTEAVAVLFTLGCRLSEPGSGNCHTRSAARHGAREHMHSCGSARTACVTIYHEPLSMFGAIDEKIYTLVLTRIIKLEHMRRLP